MPKVKVVFKDETELFAIALSNAWKKYKDIFKTVPLGTSSQLAALLELTPEWKKITESLCRLEGLEK